MVIRCRSGRQRIFGNLNLSAHARKRFRTRLLKPDVMEFTPVVERHGAYFADLRSFLVAFAEGRRKEAAEARAEGRRGKKQELDPFE